MTEYRLNKAERTPIAINNVARTVTRNGKSIVTYGNTIRLVPREVYETDDVAMIDFFKSYKRKARYNRELEEALKLNSVPYEVKVCRSCGGIRKEISYNVVEVIEE